MNKEVKLIFHPTLGKIHYKRSNKARFMRLSIDNSKEINVTIPRNCSISKAEKFLNSKTSWINKQVVKIEQKNEFTLQNAVSSNLCKKKEVKQILRNRLEELSEIHGLKFNRSFIRSQKTRWGSCSAKNNINLNIKMINLPTDLMDYIIMHELVHTKIKNHGLGFWLEMSKYYQNPKVIDKKLKQFNLNLL